MRLLAPPKGLIVRPDNYRDATKLKIRFQSMPHGPAFVGRQACPKVVYFLFL